MLTDEGEPVIVDFGLAVHLEVEEGITVSGQVVGTPIYMAPEQTHVKAGKLDERVDVYGAGAILYELLTGRTLFQPSGNPVVDMRNMLDNEPLPLRRLKSDIPDAVEAICLKAVNKDKDKRYRTCGAFRRDIERFLSGDSVEAKRPSLVTRSWTKIKKHKAESIGVLVSTILVALFGAYLFYQHSLGVGQWQLVYQQDFEGPGAMGDWQAYAHTYNWESGQHQYLPVPEDSLHYKFSLVAGALRIENYMDGLLEIRHPQHFGDNLKLEFDAKAPNGRDINFYLCGDKLFVGYHFVFGGWSNSRTVMSRGSIIQVLLENNAYLIEPEKWYHISAEKIDRHLRYTINGKTVFVYEDDIRLRGEAHQGFGFFPVGHSELILDNVRLYKRESGFKIPPLIVGDKLFERGHYAAAAEEYLNIAANFPDKKIAWESRFQAGLAYMAMDKYTRAISLFDTVIHTRRDKQLTYRSIYKKGLCLENLNLFADAHRLFTQCVREQKNISLVILILNHYNSANGFLRKLVVQKKFYLHIAYQREMAELIYDKHKKRLLDYPQSLFLISRVLQQLNDRQGSFQVLEYVKNSGNPLDLIAIANLYILQDEFQEAAPLLQEALEKYQSPIQQLKIYSRLGQVALMGGNAVQALAYFRRFLDLYKQKNMGNSKEKVPGSAIVMAYIYAGAADKFIAETKDLPNVKGKYFSWARYYRMQKQFKQALKYKQRMLETGQPRPSHKLIINFDISMIYREWGKESSSRTILQQFVNSYEAWRGRGEIWFGRVTFLYFTGLYLLDKLAEQPYLSGLPVFYQRLANYWVADKALRAGNYRHAKKFYQRFLSDPKPDLFEPRAEEALEMISMLGYLEDSKQQENPK